MRVLNPLNLAQAQSEVPWPIDFVKITLSDREILRLCNSHHDIDRGVNVFNITLTSTGIVSGNSVSIVLDGTAFTHTILASDDLGDIATALSASVNADSRYTISNLSGATFTITGTEAKDLTVLDFTHSEIEDEDNADRYTAVFEETSDLGRYYATGQFLGFGDISDELEIKNNSLDISLSGVGSSFTSVFVQANVEGSLVEVSRGYYSESDSVVFESTLSECTTVGGTHASGECTVTGVGGNIVAAPEPRWAGRVNSASIQDDYSYTDDDKVIVGVSCKSLFESLFKRQSGRYTSLQGFQKFDPSDVSMEFMASIALFTPSFGKED